VIVIPFVAMPAMPLGGTLVFPLTDAVSIAKVLCRPN
jgi:hypothetical protein